MNPAFDFLSSPGNDGLLVHSFGSWLLADQPDMWRSAGTLLVSITFLLATNKTLRDLRMRYKAVYLLILVGSWPFSCTQPDTVDRAGAARLATKSGCDQPGCVPVTTVRAPKSVPSPTPQGMPVPTFSQEKGTVAFGTKIQLSVSSLPTGAIIEYSYDNGVTWIPGDQAAVLGTTPILARTRINDLASEVSQAAFTPYYRRMMVIGNSIMDHAPLPSRGWFNHNGMAASAPEKDFVHVLTARLAQQYPQVTVRLVSGGNFEREFGQSTYSINEFNEPLQAFKPDLIIVRIGENVEEGDVLGPRKFETQFRLLLDRLATYSGQPVKIVCTTTVWRRPQTDIIIRRVATEKGLKVVDLSDMVGQDQYFAIGQYADAAVSAHPNDVGMKRIADMIWAKLP
jgi:hypothetical protein